MLPALLSALPFHPITHILAGGGSPQHLRGDPEAAGSAAAKGTGLIPSWAAEVTSISLRQTCCYALIQTQTLFRTALSLGWVGIISGSSGEGGWMCLYLPFLEYTAGFCLWSYLSPALLLYQKSWAVFSCHFVYRGRKKPKHTCEHRSRLMHSEFCPEIRKPES